MCLKRYQSLIGPPAVVPVADWLSLPNLPYSHLLLSTKSRSVYSINGLSGILSVMNIFPERKPVLGRCKQSDSPGKANGPY